MKQKLSTRLKHRRKFSSFTLVLILCNLSFAQNFANDSLIGKVVHVQIEQYKADNVMLNTLLNELEECQEVGDINAEVIKNMDFEIQRRIKSDNLNKLIIRNKKAELEEEKKKKKVWVKIGLISLTMLIGENIILLH